MTRECVAGRAGLRARVRDDQRHVDVFLVDERPLALEPSVRAAHLAMIGRENDNRILPQVHLIHDVDNLLDAAVDVLNCIEIVVVKDRPHVFAIRGDRAGPAIPAFLVF